MAAVWLVAAPVGAGDLARAVSQEDRSSALGALERYRAAAERGDLSALAKVFTSLSAMRRRGVSEYYEGVSDLRVDLVDVEVSRIGSALAVSYTRRDDFVDRQTGERVSLEIRLTRFMVETDAGWLFESEP